MKKNVLLLFFFVILIAFGTNVFATPTTIFSDNFNDLSIADWDTNAGTWSAANADLNGGNFDGAAISHSITMSAGFDYNISFQAKPGSSGTNGEIFWFTDNNGVGNINGYELLLQSSQVLFRKRTNGTPTTLISSSGVSINNYHDVNIIIANSLIQVKIDGISIGTAVNNTYTSGSKIVFATENTAGAFGFDNIVVNRDTTNYVAITVLRPIDEKTLLPIDKNWSAQLFNGIGADFQDANNNSKFFIGTKSFINTNDFVIDDANSPTNSLDEYYPRSYSIFNSPTDANTYTLQPYLAKRTESQQVTFIVWDKINNVTLSNFLVTTRHSVDQNLNVLIEQAKTNASGIVFFTLLNGINYDLTVADINGQTTYFPDAGESGQYNNAFSSYNIYITIENPDINLVVYDWNIFVKPESETLVKSASQRFDANVYTNYANSVQVILYDGNTILSNSIGSTEDFNFTTTIATNNLDSNFLNLQIIIISKSRRDIYSQGFRIVDTQGTLPNSLNSFGKNTGIFGALILTLCVTFISLQQFGGSLTGNNESQIFLVGLILIICGLLFFPTEAFFIILTALIFGIIIYLKERV